MAIPLFGFSISPGEARGVAGECREAERMGYDRVGIWDSPALFREPWVVLAAAAQEARSIDLGTWVTNPLSRHPVVTASALALPTYASCPLKSPLPPCNLCASVLLR